MDKEKMKAIVVKSPMNYGLEDVPIPDVPLGGFLLEVKACSLCGSDLRTLRGGHRNVVFPWILGHELSGQIISTGNNYVGSWHEGEKIAVAPPAYCGKCDFCLDGRYEFCENYKEIAQHWQGGLAEYLAVPEECIRLGAIEKIPDELDPIEAAVAEPISSCINSQEKGQVGLGDSVVIIGSGPVGCIHANLARIRGADKVFVIDVSDDRLKFAELFEPDATINATNKDPVLEIKRLTGGKGADVIVTATSAPVAQVQAVEMARKGGKLLIFGGLPLDQNRPGIDMNRVHYEGLHLIGSTIFAPRHYRLALKLLASKRINANLLISHRLALVDFDKGVQLALKGKALKVVFNPN